MADGQHLHLGQMLHGAAWVMSKIDLSKLDLNLLVTFEVLMTEGNVTRAAALLGRTQSAISHALERLRVQLGDPLLIKTRESMKPTPFALTLIEGVRPILQNIQRVVTPLPPFDPGTSTRVFRIALPAFSSLLSAVCERVHTAAPGVSLEWITPNARAAQAVADGHIDLAHLGGAATLPHGLEVQMAQPFSWVTFVRKNHPALSNWGVNAWTTWPHVTVNIGNTVPNPIDEAVSERGLRRTIGARISDFSGVAPLLAGTDMLGTFPPLALADDMLMYGLSGLKPPLSLPPFASRFFWSSRLANDPANRWIREIVIETYTKLQQAAEARLTEPSSTELCSTPMVRTPRRRARRSPHPQ